MKIVVILVIIPFLLGACVIEIANGNEYESLSIENQSKIRKLTDFKNLDKNYIYEITGNQLKQELKQKEKSLVYTYTHSCSSENCVPLKIVVDYANENNYNLYLVMTTYYKLDKTLVQSVDAQLFSVNNKIYNEKRSRKYLRLFETDLGYYEYAKAKDEKYVGSYMFFENDSLVDVKFNLND